MKKPKKSIPPKIASAKAAAKPYATIFAALLLGVSSFFLFTNLGHYALWDDESYTALAAQGILATGDTTAVIGHNLVAFRGGILLRNLMDRSTPPLPAYLTAPFIAVLGPTSLASRLPFALCGLLLVGLLAYWLWKSRAGNTFWCLFSLAIIGNAPMFLYFRQSRYYGAVILLSTVVAYLYLVRSPQKRRLIFLGIASVLLFASNYMCFVALYACIAVDYFIWQRRQEKLTLKDWLILGVILVIGCGLLALVWNPLKTQYGGQGARNSLPDRLKLLWWYFRDINTSEFGAGLLLIGSLVTGIVRRDRWLLRGSLAIAIYVGVITAVTPQVAKETTFADVRYLVALIPLCIFLEAYTLKLWTNKIPWMGITLAVVLAGSNLFNGGLLSATGLHSSMMSLAGELLDPPPDPYTSTAQWINQNVHDGESIWVEPDYMAYPLMFHAPKAVYAWQLDGHNHNPEFASQPAIQFQGRALPDYIIAFGPVSQQIRQLVAGWPNVSYEQVATVDCFWKDLYRPEIFWRRFKPVTGYNPDAEAIYVFKRKA